MLYEYVWKTGATSSNAIEYVDRKFGSYRGGKDQSRMEIIEIMQMMNILLIKNCKIVC